MKCETSVKRDNHKTSPSVWREWIEIKHQSTLARFSQLSPSVWREWIEMQTMSLLVGKFRVSLRVEGVD